MTESSIGHERHLLVAAYYFPPFGDVSGTRAAKFCKFLPHHGWIPHVLTVDPRYYGAKVLPSLTPEARAVDRHLVPYLRVPGRVALVKMLYPLAIILAVLRGRKRLDAIYLVGSPFHPFAVTAVITRLLGIPTILDFRDSWSLNIGYDSDIQSGQQKLVSRLGRFVKRRIEAIGIRYATRVSFVTGRLNEQYSEVFRQYQAKFLTIPNGFDPDDFVAVQPKIGVATGQVIILTGKFLIYGASSIESFFRALKGFPNLRFLYVGGEHEATDALARKVGVEGQVTTIPYSPYGEVLSLIAGADYCLVTNGVAYGVGTKIFDYLALGKRILCLVPRNSEITREFGGIESVEVIEVPHTEEGIAEGLRVLTAFSPDTEQGNVEQFSRAHSAQVLARILDEMVRGHDWGKGLVVPGNIKS